MIFSPQLAGLHLQNGSLKRGERKCLDSSRRSVEVYYAEANANCVYYQTKLLIISPANKGTQRHGTYWYSACVLLLWWVVR